MYLHIKAFPKSKKEKVIEKKEGYFDIYVREKAEFHSANRRICEIIADRFGVASGQVHILSGHHSPSKLLRIKKEGEFNS